MTETLSEVVRRSGYACTGPILGGEELDIARAEAASIAAGAPTRGGVRSVLRRSPYFKALAEGLLNDLAREIIGPTATPVKATLFDKKASANWKVPWHQDLTIAVRERRSAAGFGPWSVKDGIVHVQPPISVLESVIAVRLHLDETTPDNGALRVLPGTHLLGRVENATQMALSSTLPAVVCTARAGQVLIMSPLLLHASSSSRLPSHRRVLHFEYASAPLPSGLEWAAC